MPRVTVDLMLRETAGNDPFYADAVREYHRYTQTRMRKFPLIKHDQYGVALCVLPESFDAYFMSINGAARRNFRKAKRSGYVFDRIDFNAHLNDVRAIWMSTDTRQGRVPEYIAKGQVKPVTHPPSTSDAHDYPYFGVLKDGKLVAYAGCLVSGELCAIEQIYGHVEHQRDGVVPMTIIGTVEHVLEHYPRAKYYTYDTIFGASETLRRFKRKFGFVPHKVQWVLGEE